MPVAERKTYWARYVPMRTMYWDIPNTPSSTLHFVQVLMLQRLLS